MTIELWLLVAATVLTIVQAVVAVQGTLSQVSLPEVAGNRDDFPALTGWADRAHRAHRNMLENLVLFAILVLVAHLTESNGTLTLIGAHLFFWARLGYLFIYVIGIPWLRTAVWTVSVVGLAFILAALF